MEVKYERFVNAIVSNFYKEITIKTNSFTPASCFQKPSNSSSGLKRKFSPFIELRYQSFQKAYTIS